jgi:hypothetical protein
MERDMRNMGKWAAERYGQYAMTFAHSSSVRAAAGHKKVMEKTSKELHTVMSDAFVLYSEFAHGGIEAGQKMNADGSYDEWISNKSARHVFVSLYHLAQDLRAFVESPMARNQRRLEKLTLNEESFQSMFAKFQDDVDAHTWE